MVTAAHCYKADRGSKDLQQKTFLLQGVCCSEVSC